MDVSIAVSWGLDPNAVDPVNFTNMTGNSSASATFAKQTGMTVLLGSALALFAANA